MKLVFNETFKTRWFSLKLCIILFPVIVKDNDIGPAKLIFFIYISFLILFLLTRMYIFYNGKYNTNKITIIGFYRKIY